MTASVPNGFSFEELQAMLANAPSEEPTLPEDGADGTYGSQGRSAEEIIEHSHEMLSKVSEFCDHPIAHKAMAMMVLNNLIDWQTAIGQERDGDDATSWLRDAGKAQAAAQILKSIHVSDEDFIADA